MAARRSNKKGAKASVAKGGVVEAEAPEGTRSTDDKAKSKDHREFVSEAEEILERMFEDLSELHEQRHGSDEVDPDLVNRIFRSGHSLKGLAGMFGLDVISELSHHLEDILDGLRLGKIALESPAVSLLDDGVSRLATMMARLEGGESTGGDEAEMARNFIAQIEGAIAAPVVEGVDELAGLDLDASLLRALTEYEEHRLKENLRGGRSNASAARIVMDSMTALAGQAEGLRESVGRFCC